MRREEAIELLKLQISNAEFYARYTNNDKDAEKELKDAEAFRMAIEALSKPNYESDTEVCLVVTDRNKDKVILWDAFGEVEYYPTTHGRLIDADALMEYCSNQKTKTISNNDIARFPTISADRLQGEWIDKGDYAICSKCGGSSGTQYDGVERIPRITAFCPHCGVRMTKGGENK